jgi:bifunctional UDP-N-acetylglucosamine pyrophosphorylase/glucosamine-1-phosphate N-acetyltransferase
MGRRCAVVEAGEIEAWGVNSRDQLAQAEAVVQNRLRHAAMAAGATLLDPDSVYFCHDTILGQDVTIAPNVFFGPGVRIGDDVAIHAFCHLEGCQIAAGANIGPFARLRPETEIGQGARIGNFVEVKKARIEDGAKVNHLSYIGDARVGAGANIGAGTITCNYDGFLKSFTDIGKGAFIGSNTALVAPVSVGDGAVVGAGSTVTGDVAADALAVERAEQIEWPGWAISYRKRKAAEKAAQKK